MEKDLIIITHEHKYGVSTYNVEVPKGYKFNLDEAVEKLQIEYEPELEEKINWDYATVHQIGFDDTEEEVQPAAEDTLPEPIYWDVPVTRVGIGFRTISVLARSEQEAIDAALDEAGDHTYSEKSSEYDAPDGATPVEKPLPEGYHISDLYGAIYRIGKDGLEYQPLSKFGHWSDDEDEWILVDWDRAFCEVKASDVEQSELEEFEQEMINLFGLETFLKLRT